MSSTEALSPEQVDGSWRPSYDLTPQEMFALIAQRLEQEGITGKGIQYLEIPFDDPLADVGRTIERIVFEEKFGNDSKQMREEYGPYEDQSIFYLAVDPEGNKPVGVMRVIAAAEEGQSLKLLDDMRELPSVGDRISPDSLRAHHGIDDLSRCWELGTMAIMDGYRNSQRSVFQKGVISAQLIRALYMSARSQGIEHMVAAMDTQPYEKMVKGYLGLPYVPLADTEPFEYLGSPSTQLIYGHVPDFYPEMRAKMRTIKGKLAHSALRLLVLGKGDSSIHLPDEHTPPIYRGGLR